jgi:pentatricopeptide repeat protein
MHFVKGTPLEPQYATYPGDHAKRRDVALGRPLTRARRRVRLRLRSSQDQNEYELRCLGLADLCAEQNTCLQVPPAPAEGTACVRLGDVYSLVVDTYTTQGEWAHALEILRDMHDREIAAELFMSSELLRNIYQQNGVEPAYNVAASGPAGPNENVREGAFGIDSVAGFLLLLFFCWCIEFLRTIHERMEHQTQQFPSFQHPDCNLFAQRKGLW